MCRTKTPNIDPFNPFRADLAPEVMNMISGLRQAQRNGREPLPGYIRLLMPSRRMALVAVAFRHLSIERVARRSTFIGESAAGTSRPS